MRAGDLDEAYQVHRRVYESVRDRDPEGASQAMRELLEVASKDLEKLVSVREHGGEDSQ